MTRRSPSSYPPELRERAVRMVAGTSTGPQDAAQLGQCRRHIADVLIDLRRHGGVEGVVEVGQGQSVTLVDAQLRSVGCELTRDSVHRRASAPSRKVRDVSRRLRRPLAALPAGPSTPGPRPTGALPANA